MESISEEFSRECFDFECLSAFCFGGLVLQRKRKEAVLYLLKGKDVLAVLPTGFRKSLIYQSFVLAKEIDKALFVALVAVIVVVSYRHKVFDISLL